MCLTQVVMFVSYFVMFMSVIYLFFIAIVFIFKFLFVSQNLFTVFFNHFFSFESLLNVDCSFK